MKPSKETARRRKFSLTLRFFTVGLALLLTGSACRDGQNNGVTLTLPPPATAAPAETEVTETLTQDAGQTSEESVTDSAESTNETPAVTTEETTASTDPTQETTEATTEELTDESATETAEQTTAESIPETTTEVSEETTEMTTVTEETQFPPDMVDDVASRVFPLAGDLARDPSLARRHFPLAFLEAADESWTDWTEAEWQLFIDAQTVEHMEQHLLTEPSEPRTEPAAVKRPIITPTLMPAREPEIAPESDEAPDGRSGAELDEAFEINGIVIVNKQHWVSDNYRPLPDSENRWGLIPEARAAFDAMQADAAEEGLTLVFASGYRNYELQDFLFNDYVANNPDGVEGANRSSARPGQSEHHTGLALDIRNETDGLTLEFGRSPEGRWLWENAWRYGWILRYPQGKEHITGYVFEPWHFRYVGKEVAADFGAFNTLTLEEYLNDTLSLNAWRVQEAGRGTASAGPNADR